MTSQDALRYCENLALGGYEDWRLPNIDELRRLLRGNADTEFGGSCPVTDGSALADSQNFSCLGGDALAGPGPTGCYWNPELTGTCDKADPAAQGHYLEYWATNAAVDDPEHWIAYVSFDSGAVGFNHINSYGDVRCVRDAPSPPILCEQGDASACTAGETRQCNCSPGQSGAQSCGVDRRCFGPCECTGFTPSESITDACPSCDSLTVTVNVPERLERAPHELMVFLYAAEGYLFPPMRPPDGGTSDNQVLQPLIDLDNPYGMTLPGCSYYRESCLYGDYYLFVALYMEAKWPPIPAQGDYWWGMDSEPITFPLDGDAHESRVDAMEVTLVPVGGIICPQDRPHECPNGSCVANVEECCPDDRPHKCADGSCVAEPDECNTGSDCSPADDQVLTCRYQSLFVADNCADFPISQGWSDAEVNTSCTGMQGADPATVVVQQGNSCLVEKGALDGVTRCVADSAGKAWYAYDTPEFVCGPFLFGVLEQGPFCEPYP